MLARMQSNKNPHAWRVGTWNRSVPLGNCLAAPHEVRYLTIPLKILTKRNKILGSYKNPSMTVSNSFNTPGLETNQMSCCCWIDKQATVLYHELLLSNKKEQGIYTSVHNDGDESPVQCNKKEGSQSPMTTSFHFHDILLESAQLWRQKTEPLLSGVKMRWVD